MKSFNNLVAVVTILAQLCSHTIAASPDCKVIPGDSKWPTPEEWKEKLPTAQKQAEKGSMKHATYRIDVKTVDEVKAALEFVKKHNIRLSILNSGHDFLGRNDAPNGLVIVTTALKGMKILTDFKPTAEGVPAVNTSTKVVPLSSAPAESWLTFGVGYNTGELNEHLRSSKLMTLGAAHEGVSVAGGWGQTGGHSPLSPRYGLGADQFVEFKVITADGKLRVANAVSEPDLFWALRGGGGGSWGVVVEATVKAFPSPRMASSMLLINTTDFKDTKSVYKAAAWLHTKFPEFADQGMGMYYDIYPNAMTVVTVSSGEEGTKKWVDEKWRPVVERLGGFPGMDNKTMQYSSGSDPDFYTWFEKLIVNRYPPWVLSGLKKRHGPGMEMMATQSTGIRGGDSWLLGKEHLNSPKFAQVLEDSMPKDMANPQLRGQGIGGPGIHKRGNDTSVVPAWRKAYTHIIHLGSKDPVASAMRTLAPEMGAYLNEASRFTPGWRTVFWGSNYDRLSSIKKKYDPEHLFWVTPGINAEDWNVSGDRVCRSAATVTKVDAKAAALEVAPKGDNINVVDATAPGIDEYPGPEFMWLRAGDGSWLNPRYFGMSSWNNLLPRPSNSPEPAGGHSHGAPAPEPSGGHSHGAPAPQPSGGHSHAAPTPEPAAGHSHAAKEPASGHSHGRRDRAWRRY
ncbi:FAD-binding domain-containing protein [Microthyrium microscopicum]|uniref:FAD-binding domain-containing protein n=1 Tax=Microthyrium microscopicum TaxID=703497 RepID=A0A6A6U644_9PEZI|nr:FAD-binding domain-containing protein [Microthyrium microscopicum]